MALRPWFSLAIGFVFAGFVTPGMAHAASPPEPGAIERTIPTQIRENSSVPLVSLPGREAGAQLSDQRHFTLGAVNIDGATVFSQEQLSRYFEPYLATEVDKSKLTQMAEAITARYRQNGYLLSYAKVPTQNVEAGMVRLSVVEGRLDTVSVRGAGAAEAAIRAIASPLVGDEPLKGAALERVIGLIRDFPGLTVTDVALTRSSAEAGLFTLKIAVAPNRIRGFTYADNRGTGSVAHSRLYNSFTVSSFGVQGDELRLDVFAMPSTHTRYLYGQIFAGLPIGRNGMRLSLSASRGDQYLRADERFTGQSDNLSAQLLYPFLRSRALTLSGKAALTDWRSVGRQGDTHRLRDRLRVARFGLEFGNEGTTRFQGELVLSAGLGFGGMTRVADSLASRQDAGGKFTKVVLALQVSRALGERLNLRATGLGQYSDRPLLSAEEFSLGGNRLGRAFDFNAETGDRGAGGGLELSYRLGKQNASGVELFSFADAGFVTDLKSSVSPRSTRSLGSVGVGTRFSLAGATLSLEAAMPISDAHRKPRFFASILRQF